MRSLIVALAAAAVGAAPAAAQVVTLDEGSFTISQNGQRVGREEFSIRQTPAAGGGGSFVATATVVYDDRRLSPALRTDNGGAPLAYQVEVKMGGASQERLSGQIGRGRFSARVQTPRGESAREYVVSDGALILDDDVFHQYFFLAHWNRQGAVPVVVPRRNVQVGMRVADRGSEQLSVGGRAMDARHLTLSEPGGGQRDVWVDGRGRVLKVALPARGILATRDDAPRP